MDIAFVFIDGLRADVRLDGPYLASGKDLETAVIISLFTDRRAEPDDVVDGDDRGGWWGDTYAEIPGDRIGSGLWLLIREKQTDETLSLAREYCEEALRWMLEDGVASDVTVETEWVRMGVMGIGVEITRPSGPARFTFELPWKELKAA
jgi:phage gp46-like protein